MASRPSRSGGAGVPPGGTTTPREELADGGPPGLPEARTAKPTQKGPRPRAGGGAKRNAGSAARRRKTAGRRAERRHAVRKGRVQTDCCASWRAVPLAFFSSEGPDHKTRAPARRENAGACLNEKNRILRPPRSLHRRNVSRHESAARQYRAQPGARPHRPPHPGRGCPLALGPTISSHSGICAPTGVAAAPAAAAASRENVSTAICRRCRRARATASASCCAPRARAPAPAPFLQNNRHRR
jgi:hypothetical protein